MSQSTNARGGRALSLSSPGSRIHPGGKGGPYPEGSSLPGITQSCLPTGGPDSSQMTDGHVTALGPSPIVCFLQGQSKAHLPGVSSRIPSLAPPACCSLTSKLFPLPRMPSSPTGPNKLLVILQGPVQISSLLRQQ